MFLWLQDRYNVIPNEIKSQESTILSKVKELKRRNSPIGGAFNDNLFEKNSKQNQQELKN